MRKHRLYGIALALLFVVGLVLSHNGGASPAAFAAQTTPKQATPVVVALANDESSLNYNPVSQMSAQGAVEYHGLVMQYQKITAFAAALQSYQSQQAAAAAQALLEQERAAAAAQAAARAQARAVAMTAEATDGGVWLELRDCESGDHYADDTGNGYYGAYQFSLGTWEGLGYSGLPSEASPAVQDEAARRLQARSGWGQWPACSRRLGLV
jgi:hypothetical protein